MGQLGAWYYHLLFNLLAEAFIARTRDLYTSTPVATTLFCSKKEKALIAYSHIFCLIPPNWQKIQNIT